MLDSEMRFGETYDTCRNVRPVISFEVFPPKTAKAMKSFRTTLPELVKLRPDLITVTYGAMGSTRGTTVDIARTIMEEHGIEAACHLTCVGSTSEQIESILDQIRDAGVKNIVALRGDPPQGETEFVQAEGGYAHAVDLVRHIRRRDHFGIAVAGYPEKHIEAPDLQSDIRFLASKVDAGGEIVITQLFYDNTYFFDFLEKVRAAGIACPVVPGVLPFVSARQIKRITGMCGTTVPPQLLDELEAAGDDAEAAQEVGVRHAVQQANELLARGAPGLHFYVLNRSSHMKKIMARLSR